MTPARFPHSEIPGSKLMCSSPRLIAACHVLHRLSAPRHPPCTLSSLTKLECISRLDEPVVNAQIQLSKIPAIPVGPESASLTLASRRNEDPIESRLARRRTRERLSRDRNELESPTENASKEPRAPRPLSSAGGADRNRTDDLRLARAALSQLSYSPEVGPGGGPR